LTQKENILLAKETRKPVSDSIKAIQDQIKNAKEKLSESSKLNNSNDVKYWTKQISLMSRVLERLTDKNPRKF
jgi:hypothetical protein